MKTAFELIEEGEMEVGDVLDIYNSYEYFICRNCGQKVEEPIIPNCTVVAFGAEFLTFRHPLETKCPCCGEKFDEGTIYKEGFPEEIQEKVDAPRCTVDMLKPEKI